MTCTFHRYHDDPSREYMRVYNSPYGYYVIWMEDVYASID